MTMMKKVTTVRQNRCDEEMSFFLFGAYFLFLAMQRLAAPSARYVGAAGLALYWVFAPGFLFYLGYCYHRQKRISSPERAEKWLNHTTLKYVLYFFGLMLLDEILGNWAVIFLSEDKETLLSIIADVLSLIRISSIAAPFFAMALTLLAARVLDRALTRLNKSWKKTLLVGLLLLLCALLRSQQDLNPIIASFFGSELQSAIPCVPYFAFFLLGEWFEEKKPGFQWKTALICAAVTALSVVLYRTPCKNLASVTISFLPVYLVYVLSEGLAELTLRSRAVRAACRAMEPAFPVYAALVLILPTFGIGPFGIGKATVLSLILIAAVLIGFLATWACFRWYTAAADRFAGRTRGRTALYFVIYTALFAVMTFLVFFPFLRYGRTLVWRQDSIPQYYPRAVYFANYIRDLVSNFLHGRFELPMYDFRFGMGSEVVYSMEPLYFLNALFGAEHVETMQTVLILLRFYFAGITSSIFFLYFKKGYFATFLASAVYVFCGFSLYGGARHPMFMIAMVLLPLLILAIEEILRGQRWYLCTIFVALAMFSNYYFLYMSTFGMGVYFLVRYFCGPWKKSFKGFIGKALVISGSYLLGAAMSCIILVSNIGVYAGSGRSGSAIIKTPSLFFYSAQWLLSCFMTFPTTVNAPGDWLRLGFLPLSFFAVVLLFLRKGRKELKALSVIAVVMMALPLFGFVLSGFSSITNRWCYMIALLVAYIVADCLPELFRMSRRELVICAAAVGIYAYLAFFGSCRVTQYTKLAAIFLAVIFVLLLLTQENRQRLSQRGRQCLLVLLTFAMVFYNGFTIFDLSGVYREYGKPGLVQAAAEDTPMAATQELKDDDFYRVGTQQLDYNTISSSILYDYNSIYMFNSTMNGCILEYLEKMGASTYSVTQFMGLNNRAFLNAPAAVKYYAAYADVERSLPYGYEELLRTETNGKGTVVSENKYALPLGYTYTDTITQEELEEYGVVERQEILMQKVLLDDGETAGKSEAKSEPESEPKSESESGSESESKSKSELSLTAKRVKLESTKELGITLLENAMMAGAEKEQEDTETQKTKYRLKLRFHGLPNSETYLVLKNAYLEGDMSEEPINITLTAGDSRYDYKFRANDDRYSSQQEDYVFSVGYFEDALDEITVRLSREGTIQFDSMELYCQPMDKLESYTQALTEDVLEHVEIGTNRISGDIDLKEDKILALSIPYQNGWTAYVDGKPAKLLRANYMYMALPLEAGAHTIELNYAIPGAKYALVIMPCSVVLLVILCFVSFLRQRRRRGERT